MTGVDLPPPDHQIAEAIDRAVEAAHEETERTYLGGSVIGGPCERRLWYDFRWAWPPETFSGRMLRLFRNGHEKEARIVEDLRLAGMEVEDIDPSTGGQWAATAVGGHFRLHLDGIVRGVPTAPRTEHSLEVKTHNTKSFAELLKHGVAAAQPKHVAQMQVGMELRGLTRSLYVALNKDTEELYTERVRHDPEQAARLLAKAERIITADTAPDRIRDSADAYPCRLCHVREACHAGDQARRNCRTCLHSTPVIDGGGDGEWRCEKWGQTLSVEEQRAGCRAHRYLPSLVPGEIVDVDEADETITYDLGDLGGEGSVWTDEGPAGEGFPDRPGGAEPREVAA